MTDLCVETGPIVEAVAWATPVMGEVLELYRSHRQTLGFLPLGAFEQFAHEGRLLAARLNGAFAGYLAYRVSGGDAVIVHLCVAEESRRHGVAGGLLGRLFGDTLHLAGVRLSCRRDYVAANLMWPRFGFNSFDERPGRGGDGMTLIQWRRPNGDDLPLFARVHEEQRRSRRNVVVDANVFFDFDCDDEAAAESKSLLADWLEPEILLCVTAELGNEISRNENEALRTRRRAQMSGFYRHSLTPGAIEEAQRSVEELLPAAECPSDESDRRQLAHAVAARAEFFVTRDAGLLDHADALASLGLRVLRPVDLVRTIHAVMEPSSYIPSRLVGTRLVEQQVTTEADLQPFQAFAQAEPRSSFLGLCRRVLAEPARFTTRLVAGPDGVPILAYSSERRGGVETIPFLRVSLRHPLAGTLLRRVLAELVISAQQAGIGCIRCEDLINPLVVPAIKDVGFRLVGTSYVKNSVNGVMTRADLIAQHPELGVANVDDHAIEKQFWPVKIADTSLASYVIPIQPQWASHLFDAQLANQDLFGAEREQALALENVYYSASPVRLPTGSRILWYVSGREVGEVRASSLCLETLRLPAREAFRRFARLGIYRRHHVLDRAGGDPDGLVTAYRFAFTERFPTPIRKRRLQELLTTLQGNGNPIAGPASIDNAAFNALYTEATVVPQV